MEMSKVIGFMILNALCHGVHNAQRILMQQVLYFYIINQILEQGIFHGKLDTFQNVILVARKILSNHQIMGYAKVIKTCRDA